jgi:uncharacterized protein involved in type VI secretion and phage assembly
MTTPPNKFYGLYRGTVTHNIDPMQLGRIMADVPDVGAITTWAMPCAPFAQLQSGAFMAPQVGAGVWVQFEAGDPEHPVWMGGWWSSAADAPPIAIASAPGQAAIVARTASGATIAVSDLPGPSGGIVLHSPSGASITVNDAGIRIENGQGATLIMQGPTVSINGDALEIT